VGAATQAMPIGPVIGMRTWGGVVGIDGRFDLVDGTAVTQPKYATWFEGAEWSIENYGVDPDIEVTFPPNAWISGEDPQLERGVTEALALLEEEPAAVAAPLPAPRFGPRSRSAGTFVAGAGLGRGYDRGSDDGTRPRGRPSSAPGAPGGRLS